MQMSSTSDRPSQQDNPYPTSILEYHDLVRTNVPAAGNIERVGIIIDGPHERSALQLAELYHLGPLQPEGNKIEGINIPQYDPDKEEPLDNQMIRLAETVAPPSITTLAARRESIDMGNMGLQMRMFRGEKNNHNYATYFANFLQFDFLENFDETKLKLLSDLFSQNNPEHIVKNIKATKLLKEALTDKEWKELVQDHRITIKSKKYKRRRYIVYENPSLQVVIQERSVTGVYKDTARLCGIVQGTFPDADKLAAKIMAIKSDEDSYIAHSNQS